MPAPLTDRARRILDQMTPAERLALLDALTAYDECAEALDPTPNGWAETCDQSYRYELDAEAYARGGMRGLNESRGHDSYSPEPCGQHCYDCPRCGY